MTPEQWRELAVRPAAPSPVVGAEVPAMTAPEGRRFADEATLPNAVSIAGYLAALAYLKGYSPWFGVASILADEVDGRLARATGQTSTLGSDLDWGIDVTLTGLFADRLGILWTLPAVTGAQAYLRSIGERPTVLSVRAVMMVVMLWRSRFRPLPQAPSALEVIEGQRRAVGKRTRR